MQIHINDDIVIKTHPAVVRKPGTNAIYGGKVMDNYNNYDPNSSQPNGQPADHSGQQTAGNYNYGAQPQNGYGSQQMNNYGAQPQANGYGQQYGYNMQMAPQERKGQSIASMVLGICGFIAWLIPLFGYPVTIVGLIMGISGIKKGGMGMAIAGIICSSICLLLTIGNSVLGAMMAMKGFTY